MVGTTEEGDRYVLLQEDLFMEMVEELAEHQDKEFEIDWGEKHFGTLTYFSPTVYVVSDEEAVPEPVQ